MSAEHPSFPASLKAQRMMRRRRALRDSWPFLVWLGIAALAYWAFKQGATFTRLNGVVTLNTEVVFAPEVGRVKELAAGVAPGKRVAAGEILGKLDTTLLEKEILAEEESAEFDRLRVQQDAWANKDRLFMSKYQVLAEQTTAVGQLATQRKVLEAFKSDLKKGLKTDAEIAQVQAAVDTLTATVNGYASTLTKTEELIAQADKLLKRSEANVTGATKLAVVQLLEEQIKAMTFTANSSGVITRVLVRPNYVVAQGAPILEIERDSETTITAFIPETESTQIFLGQTVWVSIANDRAHPQEAKVIEANPVLSQITDTGSSIQGRMARGRTIKIAAPANVKTLLPGTAVIISLQPPAKIPFLSFFTQ